MKITEKYKTLLNNTGLLFVGTFGSKMISFLMLPFYTRWLSMEDFGTSDIINVYSTILVALISLCIAEAVFIIPTGKKMDEQKKFFSSSIAFALFCTILLVLLFVFFVMLKEYVKFSFIDNVGFIALLCGTNIYMGIVQQFCKCIHKIRVYAFAGILNTISVAFLGFILIKPFGLLGYVFSLVIANILAFIYVVISARLTRYFCLRAISKQHLRELLSYSMPLIPNSIIWLIVSYINRPIMESSMGIAAIGLFSLANRFPTLISTIYNNFSNSWQISVLQEFGKQGYERFYNRTCFVVFVLMCLCVSFITMVIRPVIHLFFNENYYATINYIPCLCLSTPFLALASIVGANFSAIKQSKYFFYSSIWSASSAIFFNCILIPIIGLWGACLASVISFVVGAFSRIFYSRNIVHLNGFWFYITFTLLTVTMLLLQFYKISFVFLLIYFFIEVVFCYGFIYNLLKKYDNEI